jgi:hypothetical protein
MGNGQLHSTLDLGCHLQDTQTQARHGEKFVLALHIERPHHEAGTNGECEVDDDRICYQETTMISLRPSYACHSCAVLNHLPEVTIPTVVKSSQQLPWISGFHML